MQSISRCIRFNSEGKIRIFKIFCEEEHYKILLNYKKKRLINSLTTNTNIQQIYTSILEKRLKNNIIEKNFFPKEFEKQVVVSYFNTNLLYEKNYSEEKKKFINNTSESQEFKNILNKYDLNK
jgi:hypothetical protein